MRTGSPDGQGSKQLCMQGLHSFSCISPPNTQLTAQVRPQGCELMRAVVPWSKLAPARTGKSQAHPHLNSTYHSTLEQNYFPKNFWLKISEENPATDTKLSWRNWFSGLWVTLQPKPPQKCRGLPSMLSEPLNPAMQLIQPALAKVCIS